MRQRCLVFAQEKLLELYNHLAVRFNRDLAGKFPFTRVAQALDDTDANPRDIRGFYQEYDEFMQRYDAYVARRETSGGAADVGREVNAFLASLREVRPFFAQLLVDRGNDIARYNLNLEYRVNKGNEINGQQIAEWGFSSADQKVEDGQGACRSATVCACRCAGPKTGRMCLLPTDKCVALWWIQTTPSALSFPGCGV